MGRGRSWDPRVRVWGGLRSRGGVFGVGLGRLESGGLGSR